MKHAILILAHKDISQLCVLVEYFNSDCYVFIHLDKKTKYDDDEIEKLTKLPQVIKVYRKYRVHWGGFNVLKSELYLFEQALKNCDADYFHLLSGQDYPLKPFEHFLDHFRKNKGKEFVSYMELPSPYWGNTYYRFQYYFFFDWINFRMPNGSRRIRSLLHWQKRLGIKRCIPDQFERLYGGSAWLSLTRECVIYLLKKTQSHRSLYRRLQHTFAPEETYVPTLLMNSPFRSQIENNNYRYVRWKRENRSFPANLGRIHFGKLAASDAFFARKFDHPWGDELIPLIHRYMLQKKPISYSKTGSWLHETLIGHHFDAPLSKALLRFCRLAGIESVVDLGCGPGWYVAALRKEGVQIVGYDGNPNVREISRLIIGDDTPCEVADLTDDLVSDDPFDLVLCLNAGEYIPAEYEEQVILNLVNNTKKYIILSWALSEHSKEGNRNPHSNEYLIEKFQICGFSQNIPAKNFLREQASTVWSKETLLVFQKQE